jgi:hypothetical protein
MNLITAHRIKLVATLGLYLSITAASLFKSQPGLAWNCSSNCDWYQPDCIAWKMANCRPRGSDSTSPGFASYECVTVDARSGWQRFTLSRAFSAIQSISGGWSVDGQRYAPVGASGHFGSDAQALSPYSQYKYNQNYPFGALLLGNGRDYFWVQQGSRLPSPLSSFDMRINDADNALGDNRGSLRVCFQ